MLQWTCGLLMIWIQRSNSQCPLHSHLTKLQVLGMYGCLSVLQSCDHILLQFCTSSFYQNHLHNKPTTTVVVLMIVVIHLTTTAKKVIKSSWSCDQSILWLLCLTTVMSTVVMVISWGLSVGRKKCYKSKCLLLQGNTNHEHSRTIEL